MQIASGPTGVHGVLAPRVAQAPNLDEPSLVLRKDCQESTRQIASLV